MQWWGRVDAMVLVGNLHGDRRANGYHVAQPREEGNAVPLDLLAGASAIATLASLEFAVDQVGPNSKPGRKAFDHGDQGGPVRLARRPVTQLAHTRIVPAVSRSDRPPSSASVSGNPNDEYRTGV